MTREPSPVFLRPCENLEEFGACVQLQTEVWGYEDADVIPRRSFIIASHIGGQVIGAFDTSVSGSDPRGQASTLIGFAMALPGLAKAVPGRAPQPYIHSHMLAVRPGYRNQNIGQRLKLFQREDALARGIARMEWTFDPLEIKNAFLNIVRLGAIVRRYAANLYGVSSSRLQGTLPTDRLHAEWWLESERVKSAVTGLPVPLPPIEKSIVVPRKISEWRKTADGQEPALRVQGENRRQFERAFADGLAVFGFLIDDEGNGVFQLGRWHEPQPSIDILNAHEKNRADNS